MKNERINPIIIDAPQRSPEWFKARLGKVTGSKAECTMSYFAINKKHLEAADEFFADAINNEINQRLRKEYPLEYCLRAGIELAEKADRLNYRRAIVGERLTGMPADPEQFTNYAMKWGMINEPLALALYQLKIRTIIADAPFMLHPTLKCGASPDSLVIDRETGLLGNVEVKCLMTANHLYKVMDIEKMPEDYRAQVQMQMWIDGRDFCDFVAYDSRLPDGLQIFIQRIDRDDFYIDEVLVPNIKRFLAECDTDFKRFWSKITDKGKIISQIISAEYAYA